MEEHIKFKIKNNSGKAWIYEGCGNRLLLVHLWKKFQYNDIDLRDKLQEFGTNSGVDSVMVLTGQPEKLFAQRYHLTMDVFEPRGIDPENPNLPGSWSTMCGNGIRAVARYLIDSSKLECFIKTKSGTRQIAVLPDYQFRVNMGKFTMDKKDLRKYVSSFNFEFIRSKIINVSTQEIIVGLNGDYDKKGHIDGEPHLVLFLENYISTMSGLVELANKIGPLITNNRKEFSRCINTNFVSIKKRREDCIEVLACTFERGVDYVTQACGTGATVIGSYLLSRIEGLNVVKVIMPGGVLLISRGENEDYFLTGPANSLPLRKHL